MQRGRRAVRALVLLAVAVLALAACGPAGAASFRGLGFLPGHNTSDGWGISADGSVIVGVSGSNTDWEAFRWTSSGGMSPLGHLSGGEGSSDAHGVSADGSVVVGSSDSTNGTRAFRWTQSGGMVGMSGVAGGDFMTMAMAVSSNGSVIAGYGTAGGIAGQAVRWTQGTGLVGCGFLPGETGSTAYGMSGDGSTIVGFSGSQAFRWTAGSGIVGLGFLSGGTDSDAYAASADGSVIVGYGYSSTTGTEAYRWTQAGGMQRLYDAQGVNTMMAAYHVSADGSKIVGRTQANHAAIWTQSAGMREIKDILVNDYGLNLTGWNLTRGTRISADGSTIVGFGWNPSGQLESWVADLSPVPEPSGILALGGGLLGLVGVIRRRNH